MYCFILFSILVLCFLQSGATNPEYIVTADDVDKIIAVDCIPMDEQGRQVFCLPFMCIMS